MTSLPQHPTGLFVWVCRQCKLVALPERKCPNCGDAVSEAIIFNEPERKNP